MNRGSRPLASSAIAIALCAHLAPAWPASAGARLEGRILDVAGRPASGYRVLLLDAAGGEIASSAGTTPEGFYSFARVPPGSYGLGIEGPGGLLAAVTGPPATLNDGASVRRDVRLVRLDGRVLPALGMYPGSGGWWSRQTRNQKIWIVAGIVVGAGIIAAVLGNDEKKASPSE